MAYKITNYTKSQADKLGVKVKPSKIKGKKIDVYKDGKKIASIGAIGYKDYPTYIELEKANKIPKGTAIKRRKLYKARHIDRNKVGTPSYYADKLLC